MFRVTFLIRFNKFIDFIMAGNSLSLLLGDYNSDSENDDNDNENTNQLNDKLQEFLTDLNTATIVTTSMYFEVPSLCGCNR